MREAFAEGIRGATGGELPTRAQALAALDRLAMHLAAVTGAQTDRMTRDHGWRLLTVGRLVERLSGVATRWQCFLQADALSRAAGVELLLDLCDSLITFRARYQRHEDLLPLAQQLVLDSANPRSLAGVLRRLRTELGKLPGLAGLPAGAHPLLARLPAEGAGLELEELRGLDEPQIAARLLPLAEGLAGAATALANDVSERFFDLAHGQDQRI
jgi:uncharacterized alpha-E superfamily protein